jgi:hypothetical protein
MARFPEAVFPSSSVNLSLTPLVQVVIGVADTNLCCQITGDKAAYGSLGEAACQCKVRGSVASKMTVRITTTPNFGHRPAPLAMSTDRITSEAVIGGGFATALQNLPGGIAETQTVLSMGDHHGSNSALLLSKCVCRDVANVCERSAATRDRGPTR